MEEAEREKLRKLNCKAEPIYRSQSDCFYSMVSPGSSVRSLYPWEAEANLPRLTKEYFRCKGNPANLPLEMENGPLFDCNSRHGLPVINGKEGVYPILLDLLNYIQRKTGKRVVVTCGHRCPVHNAYSDPARENRVSKHQIGAEVDFYVQGMEERPQEIAGLLMQYFQESSQYKNDKEYLEFKHAAAPSCSQSWMNKEILIFVQQKGERRDWDNRHPFAYLTLQVRYDRELKEAVVYQWAKANLGYPRGY